MNQLEKSVITVLSYYDLLERPLTPLELFKFLPSQNRPLSFGEFRISLQGNPLFQKLLDLQNGLYFLDQRQLLISLREKRLKLSQLKWKKLKKLIYFLALAPFVDLAAVTGSLTLYNARLESDFDLLLVTRPGRLWLARTFLTAITTLLGRRRHGSFTQDRFCLNCYLTADHLKIEPQTKKRDFHSAQEYGRLTLLLELKKGTAQEFWDANEWLKRYLYFYPWPGQKTAKIVQPGWLANFWREILEKLLSGCLGDWLEKKLGTWQSRRIRRKTKIGPGDQIYVSDQCLMFHPSSKSHWLMQQFNIKIQQLLNNQSWNPSP